LLLVWLGMLLHLAWPYWLGVMISAGLLVYEHALVHPEDLSRVDIAFFNINSIISVTLFVAVLVSLMIG